MAQRASNVIIASSIGITLSACFVGAGLLISYVTLPSLLLPATQHKAKSPASTTSNKAATPAPQLARQWQTVFNIGAKAGPGFVLPGAATFVYAALQLPKSLVVQRRLYFAAAGLAIAVVPFTWTMMKRTNGELHRRANLATQGVEEDDEVLKKRAPGVERYQTQDLINWWGTLNATRGLIPLLAITAATTAMVW